MRMTNYETRNARRFILIVAMETGVEITIESSADCMKIDENNPAIGARIEVHFCIFARPWEEK